MVLYLRNLHCGELLSRLTEAACAVIKLSIHSVDIYITEKTTLCCATEDVDKCLLQNM
jgi:hypothetical protein